MFNYVKIAVSPLLGTIFQILELIFRTVVFDQPGYTLLGSASLSSDGALCSSKSPTIEVRTLIARSQNNLSTCFGWQSLSAATQEDAMPPLCRREYCGELFP